MNIHSVLPESVSEFEFFAYRDLFFLWYCTQQHSKQYPERLIYYIILFSGIIDF